MAFVNIMATTSIGSIIRHKGRIAVSLDYKEDIGGNVRYTDDTEALLTPDTPVEVIYTPKAAAYEVFKDIRHREKAANEGYRYEEVKRPLTGSLDEHKRGREPFIGNGPDEWHEYYTGAYNPVVDGRTWDSFTSDKERVLYIAYGGRIRVDTPGGPVRLSTNEADRASAVTSMLEALLSAETLKHIDADGVDIEGRPATFAELRADVKAANLKGLHGERAFCPETVAALLDYIDTLKAYAGGR